MLVCNADDPRVMARAAGFAGRIVTFGTVARRNRSRDATIEDLGIDGMRARVIDPGRRARDLTTPLLGRGNLANVLAATAVALDFDVPLDDDRRRGGTAEARRSPRRRAPPARRRRR